MSTQFVHELTVRVLAGKREGIFRSPSLYEPYRPVEESDLAALEERLGHLLPQALRAFLMVAGYGDLNDVLSFREEWFAIIDGGELHGHVFFAQDILGNFYSFDPGNGHVHFICRSSPEYAPMAAGFYQFLCELERYEFALEAWTDSLNCLPI